MQGSELLLEFSVRQNRLLEILDRLHFIAEDSAQASPETSLQSAHRQFTRLQEHVKEEISRFRSWVASAGIQDLAVGPHLEKISLQAQALVQSLGQRFRETDLGDWKKSLAQIGPTIEKLRADLKEIDLRAGFAHAADAILIDRLESLGKPQVIQWPRKIWHMLAAAIIISIYLFIPVPFQTKMIVFGCFTALAVVCDVSRLLSPAFNARVVKDLQKYMRQREVNHLNSMTFYALSTFFTCLLFPKGIAILSILFLGLGDTAASIVGVTWGRHKFGGRFSLEGSLAFFGVCTLVCLFYPLLNPAFHGPLWLFAPVAGLIGAYSERVFPRLDDNLVIPLFSATAMSLLLAFF
ncbi:MAG: SEC59/DGK1/VTE5 family protein [Deltaproteobacteria bacterium]|nr:SEC59/DGK1/VTE5 family protein [Deltaproteobacteria bacterium]